MSIIHVNQIKNHLESEFTNHIDLSDVKKAGHSELENYFLTRALAAYVVKFIANIDVEKASKSVTDGPDDNGIDAIYYDEKQNILYLVQSKWIHDGKSEPANGDIKKYRDGVKDLFNQRFELFNEKICAKKDDIKKALHNAEAKYKVIVVYTGVNFSKQHNQKDLDDFSKEINDANEVLSIEIFNQTRLHDSLKIRTAGEPIDLMIGLREWGKKVEPQKAYYGQVNGLEVAEWWKRHNNRLFAKNLRELIGETEVNKEIKETIEMEPNNFWYYNNGITIVCKSIEKTMLGGADNTFGQFMCKDISIVNGAQTVGTIGKYGQADTAEHLNHISVPLRLISLEDCNEEFGKKITRNNNRQNRIENRDFVALDPVQQSIQTELAIEGIIYNIMRSANDKMEKNPLILLKALLLLLVLHKMCKW